MATPKMTAEQAKSFDTVSPENSAVVRSSLHCSCQPYQDVFTYGRWQALGMQVQKGQKGIRIGVVVATEVERDGEMKKKTFPKMTSVFCRCQVAPIEVKK